MSDIPLDALSPGEMLRTARERQGLHIAALAAAIKVAPRKLDALEHDRWDELPDTTFVRALAQTVCRTLKMDPAPVLALLPPAGAIALKPGSGGLNAPFHDRPGRDVPGLSLGAVRPMVVAASVLMLAAIALVFVPDGYWTGGFFRSAPAPVAAGSAASAAAPAVAPAASAAVADIAASTPTPATGLFPPADAVPALAAVPTAALPTGPVPVPVPMPAPALVPAPVAAIPIVAPPQTPFAPGMAAAKPSVSVERPMPPGAATGAGALRVRTTGVSWIEARDGSGRVLLSRMVQAGERLDLDVSAPIRLTIGNAAVTRLDFRGQPVDLQPSTRDNVARVELK